MIDPPRPEAIAAVAKCRLAGIRVKMITGDHAITARAIAGQIGLGDPGTEIRTLTGRELEGVSDDDLPRVADETTAWPETGRPHPAGGGTKRASACNLPATGDI